MKVLCGPPTSTVLQQTFPISRNGSSVPVSRLLSCCWNLSVIRTRVRKGSYLRQLNRFSALGVKPPLLRNGNSEMHSILTSGRHCAARLCPREGTADNRKEQLR